MDDASTPVQSDVAERHDSAPGQADATGSLREASGHGEEILLPEPNAGPLVVGLGVTVLVLGLIWTPLLVAGALVTLAGVWVLTARSRRQRKADHHVDEETRRLLPGISIAKLGMWVFLASEVMFFAALIASYIAFRSRPEFNAIPTEEGTITVAEALNLPLTTLNTFLLLASSFTAASALAAVHKDNQRALRRFLFATLVLGAIFVSVQGFEWYELMHKGVGPETLFGTAFFTTTGFHGLHVILGLVALVYFLVRAFRGVYSATNALSIELFGLYWHFVDVVWIVLFTVIYLIKI